MTTPPDGTFAEPPRHGRTTTRRAGTAVLLSLGLLAAACGDDGNGDDNAASNSANGEGCDETVNGTELTYGTYAPIDLIDPTLVNGALVGGTELLAVYDSLLIYDYDSEGWEPHLAESLTPNDDHTEWTLELPEDITFSDGTPLTADLVDENLDRFFSDDAINTSAGFMTPIVDREVTDQNTLVITLDRSWAEFPFVFADEPGMIVNTNAIDGDLNDFATQPADAAGLGPYVVERNAPGEELVMTARDDYWGGPVCIETLRFVFRPGTTYEAFQADDLDAGFLRDPGDIEQAREQGDDNHFVLQDSGEVIMVNMAEGRPGDDPRVREAVALAIDETVVNDRAYEGTFDATKALVSEDSRFHSDALEPHPTDPDRAEQLLDEAMADGFDGAIQLACTNSPAERPDIGLAVEGMLSNVGFDVDLQNLDQSDQLSQVVQHDFDLACWGLNAGPDTGITTFNRVYASDSETNRMSYADDDMDDALADLFAAETDEERHDAMAQVQDIANQDPAVVTLGHIEEGLVWAPEVHGIVPTGATMYMFHDAFVEG